MTTVHFGQFCLVIYVFIIAMTLKPLTDIIIQCTIIILSDCHKAHVNRIQHTYKSFKIWYNKLISKVHINTKKKSIIMSKFSFIPNLIAFWNSTLTVLQKTVSSHGKGMGKYQKRKILVERWHSENTLPWNTTPLLIT